ncbi:hypothetical protein A2Z33_03955 [Candidatus Gottesmanbacteria bacterium RBG_16_52_11]|uniref:Glycosyltransferase RgtA/B/C/D-like domain-containing protein n=1 Tax=Candidatus Gottesmanbacteria bacterium RBG_16_52_11 TaxID=1798374 RepID=A0A1F5YVX9_9BACT|nr:MAG: hypothetical protein A2Z33_03955 [Candidatus Gottesmanbacteria bacterium RBG_16_52_11]
MRLRINSILSGRYLFILLLVMGLIYRIIFASLSDSGLFWDMERYHGFAVDILSGRWAADCCNKNVGYGAFLAGIYAVFGLNNLTAVRLIQVAADLAVSVFVYLTAGRLFGRREAMIAFIIYLTNPVTSSYTGLRLPESLSLLVLSLLGYIFTLPGFKTKPGLWISTGLLLGVFLFIRQSFYLFVLAFMALGAFLFFRRLKRIAFLAAALGGFFAVSWYTLAANYAVFNKISLVAPYHASYSNMYYQFYQPGRWPELTRFMPQVDPRLTAIVLEYYATPDTQKDGYERKYKRLFLERLKTDWPLYLRIWARNAYLLWDKEYLFTYTDRFYPADRWPVRIYNTAFLALFFGGLVKYALHNRKRVMNDPLLVFVLMLMGYITFTFSLVSNESRHTVVCYAYAAIWAGYTLAKLIPEKAQIQT